MSGNQILVATDKKYAQVRVIGRGSFLCSQNLRDFCIKLIETNIKKIIIDLSECVSMDSTFMGVLALVGRRGKEKNLPVEIVNVGEAKKKLLKGLGLEKLFKFSYTKTDRVNWSSLCNTTGHSQDVNQLNRARTMLEAHETLIEVNDKNQPKFKDVIEYLKEDIRKLSK